LRSLLPDPRCWFAAEFEKGDGEISLERCPEPAKIALASFAWYELNKIRVWKELPIILPANGDLMGLRGHGGVLGGLYETQGASATLRLIATIADNVETILDAITGQYKPAIDAGLFHNKLVIREAEKLLNR
jgi:hypothetical protein